MATLEVNYFNSYILNRLVDDSGDRQFPTWLGGSPTENSNNWFIEESRIRGGYNNTQTDQGVRAYIVEDQQEAQDLSSGIIYSGIFNSRTGFNETNVFSVGEDITKSLDPSYGSIQLLYAEDTNLNIFQEDKVSRALIDKDAIYSAEGGGSITSSKLVIGQIVPYAGEFGISKDPDSFSVYGYRKYFTDRKRNAVLRLSMDGITEIQGYGMLDFFRDEFAALNGTSKVVGAFDIHNKVYVTSVQKSPSYVEDTTVSESYKTLYFDETVNGWVSFLSFKPTLMGSLRSKFFSFYNGKIYQHYSDEDNTRGNFYDTEVVDSSVEFIFNPRVSMPKVLKTINYEGGDGWKITSIQSDSGDVSKEIYSYGEGAYVENNIQYRAGFDKKENKYFANIINNTLPKRGEIVFQQSISGIKGMYYTVNIKTDSSTNVGGSKELFAVSGEYIESSY